jgi:hypothetical protein
MNKIALGLARLSLSLYLFLEGRHLHLWPLKDGLRPLICMDPLVDTWLDDQSYFIRKQHFWVSE